jgi:hypothetical protein
MGLSNDGGVSKFPPGNPGLGQTTGPNSSLQEAWFHILDRYAVDTPLSEVIFPLMRNCFFGGAMHAVFLLQNGHGDQLASDIAGFIAEEPQSCAFAQEGQGIFHRTGIGR